MNKNLLSAHLSLFVHLVVGQFDFLEGDHLLAELVRSERRIRMSVETGRRRRVGFAGHQPRRTVVGVTVTLAVDRYNVQQNVVAYSVTPVAAQVSVISKQGAGEGDSNSWEHTSTSYVKNQGKTIC